MASFERIVRPVLPASIRPAQALQAQPSESDTPQTLSGRSGARVVTLSHSYSMSFSKEKKNAQFRVYDKVRVYRPGNHAQYVDTEVNTYIRMKDALGILHDYHYYHPQENDDIRVLERDVFASIPDSQRG